MSNVTTVSKPLPDLPALVDARAATLYVWAGRALTAIATLHIAFFVVDTNDHWSEWATGELWGAQATTRYESLADFWALPGGFAAPLIVLGLLITRLARAGRAVPAYVGWTLTAWVVLCALILMPSGFLLGLIPAGMLLTASWRNSRAVDA
ncbi:DUF6463 family protein [Nocardia sp. NPDC050406]|uniref:DUF6463 family protein n=1 Tax=Nocardia sp. NPDC050406 TaxID=3364318 RepID=UPI003788A494